MSAPAVALEVGRPLDGCDAATLAGIVREALEASPRFRVFAEFRNLTALTVTSTDQQDSSNSPHSTTTPIPRAPYATQDGRWTPEAFTCYRSRVGQGA